MVGAGRGARVTPSSGQGARRPPSTPGRGAARRRRRRRRRARGPPAEAGRSARVSEGHWNAELSVTRSSAYSGARPSPAPPAPAARPRPGEGRDRRGRGRRRSGRRAAGRGEEEEEEGTRRLLWRSRLSRSPGPRPRSLAGPSRAHPRPLARTPGPRPRRPAPPPPAPGPAAPAARAPCPCPAPSSAREDRAEAARCHSGARTARAPLSARVTARRTLGPGPGAAGDGAGVWHPRPGSSWGWRARRSLPPCWVQPARRAARGSPRGLASARLPRAAQPVPAGPGSGALSLRTARRALRPPLARLEASLSLGNGRKSDRLVARAVQSATQVAQPPALLVGQLAEWPEASRWGRDREGAARVLRPLCWARLQRGDQEAPASGLIACGTFEAVGLRLSFPGSKGTSCKLQCWAGTEPTLLGLRVRASRFKLAGSSFLRRSRKNRLNVWRLDAGARRAAACEGGLASLELRPGSPRGALGCAPGPAAASLGESRDLDASLSDEEGVQACGASGSGRALDLCGSQLPSELE
ncbi:transcription initiation factor TFIID subunit 4-like [Hippopotamus amphibius kiboko]|uniref:transcription initiation factor TFIID subunit 4-like n=1 Tax=Hippopotamus amphibius kiboko TaxID=575201 RepID=UPI002596B1DF|nr:transcription initiation factor TFIID subunit 4-like [Hippopotamus amphibius kiboko]